MSMSVCPNFAELIFQHVDDSVTWCRLAQVNKQFNKVSKQLLVRRIDVLNDDSKVVWHELPAIRSQPGCVPGLSNAKHGLWQTFKPNGNDNCDSEGYYLNNMQTGMWWYKSHKWGELLTMNYLNGHRHGLERTYNREGRLVLEKTFLKGYLHGPCRQWYPNGKLKLKCNYWYNSYDGLYLEYSLDGRIISQREYQNGSVS